MHKFKPPINYQVEVKIQSILFIQELVRLQQNNIAKLKDTTDCLNAKLAKKWVGRFEFVQWHVVRFGMVCLLIHWRYMLGFVLCFIDYFCDLS